MCVRWDVPEDDGTVTAEETGVVSALPLLLAGVGSGGACPKVACSQAICCGVNRESSIVVVPRGGEVLSSRKGAAP